MCGQGTDICVTPASKSPSPRLRTRRFSSLFFFSAFLLSSHGSFYLFMQSELQAKIIYSLSVLNEVIEAECPFRLEGNVLQFRETGLLFSC